MKISMVKSKRRLSILWFIGAAIIFSLVLVQSITGKHGAALTEVWGWTLQTIMPTLSLMLSVFVLDALGKGVKIKEVDRFFYRLTFTLSLIYICLVLFSILAQPFASTTTMEWLKQSNIWLGSLQGLVGISLGIFFFKE